MIATHIGSMLPVQIQSRFRSPEVPLEWRMGNQSAVNQAGETVHTSPILDSVSNPEQQPIGESAFPIIVQKSSSRKCAAECCWRSDLNERRFS
jgi:hypothetical protein